MGLFSSMTTGIYRETHDGRRVMGLGRILPRPKAWYLVTDDALPGFERRYKQFFGAALFVIPGLVGVLTGFNVWAILATAMIFPAPAMRYWVLRGLPRIAISEDDLVPIDWKARTRSQLEAMGEPMLWALLVATIAMASLDVYVLRTDGTWWAWLGLVMFGSGSVWLATQVVAIRRSRQS